jgi:hypothetical protein
MALHVDEPTRFEIAATMRGRAKVHEHPLARLVIKPTALPMRLAMSLIALFLAVGTAGATQAVHSPSTAEEAGIRQAIFDYVAANALARRPVITRMRVSSITLTARPAGPRRYRKFARVDLSDPSAGFAAALLGYYVASISGWRVLGFGSARVGCTPRPQVFQGKQNAILLDLQLGCS